MFMRIILIILVLLFSSNLYSQPDGIFVKKDGVLVISNDLKTDRKNGYAGTSSNKARKLYNKAYDLSFTDVYKAIELYNEALDFDPYFVETYDNLGRLIYTNKKDRFSYCIETTNLKSGIYFLSLNISDDVVRKKIIIE